MADIFYELPADDCADRNQTALMTKAKHYLYWILGLLGAELASWLAFSSTSGVTGAVTPMRLAFVIIGLVGIWLAWKKPVWLTWLTLAELVIGGKGYLFFFDGGGEKLSLRMLLYSVLVATWVIHVAFRRWSVPRWGWAPLAVLGWVGVMSLVGWARGFGLGAVLVDMNGYLYIGLVFPWWYFLRRDPVWRERLLTVLLSGATVIGLKSWSIQFLFAQNPENILEVYRWIRQTGIGEITLISKNVYRIFFQSQIYALLGLVLVLGGFLRGRVRPWWAWALLGSSLGVYVSLSRSLWLGLGVALGGMIIALAFEKNWRSLRRFGILIPTAAFVWLMTAWALNFPYIIPPPGRPSRVDTIVARLKSAGSEQASTARANQIPPLLSAIAKNPVTGHGFGATLTYDSTDPRIRGRRTTSAFELGYLDMLFHIGLVGLGLLAWWIWGGLSRLWHRPAGWIWLWPTLALAAVHLTSPYLNHPLGLGWIAVITLLAHEQE